jgi:hypothetical protein
VSLKEALLFLILAIYIHGRRIIMDTFDYKPNSYKSKDEQANTTETKRVEKVVKGNVTTKKKSETAKLGDTLKDGLKDAKEYLVKDVLVPSAKDLIVDLVTKGINILVRGSAAPGNRRTIVDKVSYNNKYWGKSDYREEARPRARLDYDEIEFKQRAEAEMVLDQLDNLIDTYGHARVADLYDLVGVSCDYTYQNYGWTNLGTARVVATRDGYVLDLPRVTPIRR